MSTIYRIMLVLIPIALGQAFRQLGLFGDEEGEAFEKLVVRLCVPVLVFFALYDMPLENLSAMPRMMGGFVLMTAALFCVGWLCSLAVEGPERKAAVQASVMLGNYGWMGLGVCGALLGDPGTVRVVFFISLWWPVFYGFGLPIGLIHAHRRKEAVPLKRVIAVAAPTIACLIAGLLLNVAGVELPSLVGEVFRPFDEMTVPLILFSVGCMLNVSRAGTNMRPALLVSAATLLVGPFIGWGLGYVLAGGEVTRKVLILEGAMPVATLTPVLAANVDMDADLVRVCIALSTLLSLGTLPLVAALVV